MYLKKKKKTILLSLVFFFFKLFFVLIGLPFSEIPWLCHCILHNIAVLCGIRDVRIFKLYIATNLIDLKSLYIRAALGCNFSDDFFPVKIVVVAAAAATRVRVLNETRSSVYFYHALDIILLFCRIDTSYPIHKVHRYKNINNKIQTAVQYAHYHVGTYYRQQ